MSKSTKLKAPWRQKFFIIVLSILLGVLLFWLLGFVTNDIGSIRGPQLDVIEAKYVAPELLQKEKAAAASLAARRQDIKDLRQRQEILKNGTSNLQATINQLLDIRKQSLDRHVDLSQKESEALADSQKMFLENQKQYQVLNEHVANLTGEQQQLESELGGLREKIKKQRQEAHKEYDESSRKHRMKVAGLKLAFLLPIFLVCTWVFLKKRTGAFGPIVYAVFITVFVKVFLVVHEHFPSKYFKYIALVVVIGIVLKLLLYLLRMVISPQKAWLIKQYQEAYDQNLCPICTKPVRTGPLRYAVWRRRKERVTIQQGTETSKYEVYTCPSCGTQLYEECAGCKGIRHSLLPFCEHCGSAKEQLAVT